MHNMYFRFDDCNWQFSEFAKMPHYSTTVSRSGLYIVHTVVSYDLTNNNSNTTNNSTMKLAPREIDHLLLSQVGQLAQKRLAR
jgi:hypothetical protein